MIQYNIYVLIDFLKPDNEEIITYKAKLEDCVILIRS